jgi:predicted PurR-regulated permease PerM
MIIESIIDYLDKYINNAASFHDWPFWLVIFLKGIIFGSIIVSIVSLAIIFVSLFLYFIFRHRESLKKFFKEILKQKSPFFDKLFDFKQSIK